MNARTLGLECAWPQDFMKSEERINLDIRHVMSIKNQEQDRLLEAIEIVNNSKDYRVVRK